jgi:hypothetical protein
VEVEVYGVIVDSKKKKGSVTGAIREINPILHPCVKLPIAVGKRDKNRSADNKIISRCIIFVLILSITVPEPAEKREIF